MVHQDAPYLALIITIVLSASLRRLIGFEGDVRPPKLFVLPNAQRVLGTTELCFLLVRGSTCGRAPVCHEATQVHRVFVLRRQWLSVATSTISSRYCHLAAFATVAHAQASNNCPEINLDRIRRYFLTSYSASMTSSCGAGPPGCGPAPPKPPGPPAGPPAPAPAAACCWAVAS